MVPPAPYTPIHSLYTPYIPYIPYTPYITYTTPTLAGDKSRYREEGDVSHSKVKVFMSFTYIPLYTHIYHIYPYYTTFLS